ncbi:tRNA uridine-5-carboxymethylaminomethyl(34) synthesis GTPase MnmE [bacterium]|nr:tRNA uridine-5-carboxymethylaminomethyl(34) synthesis GTPase MnmE [bacterium]
MTSINATIFAPLTALGHAAIHAVRVSGPGVKELVLSNTHRAEEILKKPRTFVYSRLDNLAGQVIDFAMCAFFEGPKSYTGEDVCEFQIHGSPVILKNLLDDLSQRGLRLAEPGEFTRRAYLNGQMDLSQAEAIADLIHAESAEQVRVAREQLEGKLSGAVDKVGEPLRDLLSEIEAFIDFPEEDIDPQTHLAWQSALQKTQAELFNLSSSFNQGRIFREGARVVLAGLPNAGKSSLLNALLGENRAIVTPIPGTTRDTIEEKISLQGLLIRLTDTAGIVLEQTREIDPVEQLGIARSREQIEKADLVLFLIDCVALKLPAELATTLKLYRQVTQTNKSVFAVLTKVDLLSEIEQIDALHKLKEISVAKISTLTGQGIKELCQSIPEQLLQARRQNGTEVMICTARHFQALKSAESALERARQGSQTNLAPELISFEVREALSQLDEIIGVTHTEEILGRIFSKFCIGK